ncbi:MAG: hypothetical protein AAF927_06495 [Bacteroidota bacterium]
MGGKILLLACHEDGIGAATLGYGDELEHIAPKSKKGKKKAPLRNLGDLLSLILKHFRRAHLNNQNSSVPVVLGFEAPIPTPERQSLTGILREHNFYLIHQDPYDLDPDEIGEEKKSAVLSQRQQQLSKLLQKARLEISSKLEAGEDEAFWLERAAILGLDWQASKDVIPAAEPSEIQMDVDFAPTPSDQLDTMASNTLQTELSLPSLKDVFELRHPLPPQNGQPSYWRLEGLYILGQQPKILHGLSFPDQSQKLAFESVQRLEKRYYGDRVFVSAINRAQEGIYYHRDFVEANGVLLSDFFAQLPKRLKLSHLELVAEIYAEAERMVSNYQIYHPSLRADDILIMPGQRKLMQKVVGTGKKWEILFLNFPPKPKKVDMEALIHSILTETIGSAYDQEFANYVPL